MIYKWSPKQPQSLPFWMVLLVLAALLFVGPGCKSTNSNNNKRKAKGNYRTTAWRYSGGKQPSRAQLTELKADFAARAPGLSRDLVAKDTLTRRRAAFVIESVGAPARPILEALLAAFKDESDPVNQAFMIRAIAAAGGSNRSAISALRKVFYHTEEPVLHAYAAGAIIRMNGLKHSEEELQVLLDSLNPNAEIPAGPSSIASRKFWEIRWAAAYMTERLGADANPLLPALEQLTEAENVPAWVRKQLWFALNRAARHR